MTATQFFALVCILVTVLIVSFLIMAPAIIEASKNRKES